MYMYVYVCMYVCIHICVIKHMCMLLQFMMCICINLFSNSTCYACTLYALFDDMYTVVHVLIINNTVRSMLMRCIHAIVSLV